MVDAAMLSSFREFAAASPLRRACCGLAAWSLDVSTQAAARQCYLDLAQETGDATLDQLATLLEEAGAEASEAAELCASFDASCDGRVAFTSFLSAAVPASALLSDERLSESFLRFDADAYGRVTAADVSAVLGQGALADAVALEVGTGVCLAELGRLREALALEKVSDAVYETQSVGDIENGKDAEAVDILVD